MDSFYDGLVHRPIPFLKKLQACDGRKSNPWPKSFERLRKMEATVHFGNLTELVKYFQIQKRRGVREERTPLKTKEGYRAVFAEQEASASIMAAASCLDPTFKTSWCGWRGKSHNLSMQSSQNDRSPSSPVPPSLPSPDSLKSPQEECREIWIRSPHDKIPKVWKRPPERTGDP